MPELRPMRVVIPTGDREFVLRRTLKSLAQQEVQPAELTIVDASTTGETRMFCQNGAIPGLSSTLNWLPANEVGAATQRNQGVHGCPYPVVGFMDDDILLEPDCVLRLWNALHSSERIGGVNAMITNQRYQSPGRISRMVFRLMAGCDNESYAGAVIGPAVNLLPEDREDLPEVVAVQWLNTTCTLYRRDALPDPIFPEHFRGYSVMEDVSLSLAVGRTWRLANARTARIYHDSQPGNHKRDPLQIAEMQLINRHYVMTRVLGRTRISDYLKLLVFELFSMASLVQVTSGKRVFTSTLRGKAKACWLIATK